MTRYRHPSFVVMTKVVLVVLTGWNTTSECLAGSPFEHAFANAENSFNSLTSSWKQDNSVKSVEENDFIPNASPSSKDSFGESSFCDSICDDSRLLDNVQIFNLFDTFTGPMDLAGGMGNFGNRSVFKALFLSCLTMVSACKVEAVPGGMTI